MSSLDDQARLDALIGRVLGDKFRLRACIGIGGTGAVYRADQIALGRTVAVKILAEELAEDPKLVRRFHDEALAASRLNHPNTVSVIDYGQTPDGLLYLVMELVRGPTLTQLVAEGPLVVDRALDIVGQILAGIEEAHLNGVVHADLKSDNVIVDQRRADWDVVKVVDFGIARLLFNPPEGEDRSICGTPEYMAPETITGAAPSFVSDLYSVGIIFYELLVGHTPFVGGTTVEILTRQLRQAPTPPSQLRHGLAGDVEAVCLRAIAKHPQDRYPDAGAFKAAILQLREARRAMRSANMAICESCNAQIPARFRFCPECGQPRAGTVVTASADTQEQSSPAIVLPMVGRDAALEAVVEHLRADTVPAVMSVCGVAASGRSKLLREAYQRLLDGGGVTVYQAGPDPTGLATPLYPIRAVTAAALALPPVCTLEELGRSATELGLTERDLPGLAELFGHPGSLVDLEPLVRRREMVASTVRALHAAAAISPMALVFENIDLYDSPSQEIIRRLGERSEECRALRIVVTMTPALAAQWQGRGQTVEVGPLDVDAIRHIVAEARARGIADPPDPHRLLALSGGLPGHIDQCIQYVTEGGTLDDSVATIPDLIAARASHLPQPVLELCQTAAVFGYDVDRTVLTHACALGPRAFESNLSALIAHDLVRDADGIVTFTSPALRDIVYDSTPGEVRRHLHGVAAELLAQTTTEPALLGHHHDMAGATDPAADYLARAGDVATRYLDDAGACALYQRALRAARAVLYASDEDKDVHRYVTLSVKLAGALGASGQVGLARGVLDEARPWAAGIPRLEAHLGRAAAQLALAEDDAAAATAHVRRAIGSAIASGDGALITELYLDLAGVLTRGGDPEGARRELEEGIDMVTFGEGVAARGGPPDLWRLVFRLAQLSSGAGDHARAVKLGEHALAQARRAGSRLGSARVQVLLATECDRLGDAVGAAGYRADAITELRQLGDRRTTAELLLAAVATRTLLRIDPPALTEARALAAEIGWEDGARAGAAGEG